MEFFQSLGLKFRRFSERMQRRGRWGRVAIPFLGSVLLFACLMLTLGAVVPLKQSDMPVEDRVTTQINASAFIPENQENTIAPDAVATLTPTPTPIPEPTPIPTPEPVYINGLPEAYYFQTAAPGSDLVDPAKNGLTSSRVYIEETATNHYVREDSILMSASSEYTELEGIVTFRGNNYRDTASYGTIPENPTDLEIVWRRKVGGIDSWRGVGWTGQASAVRWPESVLQSMNINSEKKAKGDLVEVVYGTLDGNIYFLDLEDGEDTRNKISIGAPIKGSLSLDPRGYPLLYCGQGIYEIDGKRVSCGMRIWSLVDQSLLHMIDGRDDLALRRWYAFDCSPLIDAETDTLIEAGENGVLYTLKLNTTIGANGKVSIDPETVRYVYNQSLDGQVGTENSPSIYNNYIYFANNTGIIQCVDLNTLTVVWSFNAQDDIDASLVIEVESDGLVALYAVNEMDIRGDKGNVQMFKLNALTGELLWSRDSAVRKSGENEAGGFATPALGKGALGDLVFFHIARTEDTGGMLYALNKQTGESVWEYDMGRYGWSSPACVYSESGRGYVLVGSANGRLRLFDGLTGQVVTSIDLETNIESSPIVYDDMIVIGVYGGYIYGIRIS